MESRCGHVSILWFGLRCVSGQKIFSGGFPYIGHIKILRFM